MGLITVHTFQTAGQMGAAAANHAARQIQELAATRESVAVVFATGASQLETLRALVKIEAVPWGRVTGFHLDEYLGIPPDHPASFRRYLKDELTSLVPFREFHWLQGDAQAPERVCRDYAAALRANPPLLCLLGIGENGHLAFNDPAEADFADPLDVKLVDLDRECRQQQVNEGWFSEFAHVPARAITLTIPAILRIPELILSVPGRRKATVVARALYEKVSTACPATILQEHPNTRLYLDSESASAIKKGSPVGEPFLP
jgi:glucosamine-6-phosphate deaminase